MDPRRTYQVFGSVRHVVPDGGAEGVVAGHDVPQHVHLLPVPERGRPAEPEAHKCSVFSVYHGYNSGEAVLLLGFQKKRKGGGGEEGGKKQVGLRLRLREPAGEAVVDHFYILALVSRSYSTFLNIHQSGVLAYSTDVAGAT